MAGFRPRVPAPADITMIAHHSVTLLFDLSDGADLAHDARGRYGRGSVAVGLLPGDFRASGRAGEVLQIRLEPVAAAALLGAPADLSGEAVPLEDVWGRDAAQAEDRLRAAGTWGERFTAARDILTRRLTELTRPDTRPPVDQEVAHAWRRTLGSRGRVRVGSLADEVGWSRKRLSARFSSQLGIAPKRAARLVRFDHAAHLLAAGRTAAGVATESGYVDQPHLHRDVKEFTGLTPAAVATAPWLAIDDLAWPASPPPAPMHQRP
ncbi:AraC family transcriptional regulator [Streptomyces reniochalinae]|uniref:AraC family transcriptional regulator n=2 Tax=Streptomyces reniochalinae TaxID=2250578 RepID=A0A367EFA2_9ACTN|nr:AraC family transcriptional regulator [Streptomyces reniochalinae]